MRVVLLALVLMGADPRPTTPPVPTLGALASVKWIGRPVAFSGPATPKATLVRFWTDGCPHCRLSLPSIAALRREFHGRGLETIAVYHSRGPRPLPLGEVEATARALGYDGPIAMDSEWRALQAVGLGERSGKMTSASFLFDHGGAMRFTHPGPELHASSDPEHQACDRDLKSLRAAVEAVLR